MFSSIFKSFFDTIKVKKKGKTGLADFENKQYIVDLYLTLSQQKRMEKYNLIEGIIFFFNFQKYFINFIQYE